MKTRPILSGLVAAAITASSLPAQIYFTVTKGERFDQTDASTVAVGGATPWFLTSDITGAGVSSSVPTAPNQITPPALSAIGLAYSAGYGGWSYEQSDMGKATLDTLFPNGLWTLAGGGNTWNLTLGGDLYPNAPTATFSAGTWSGGVLHLTAAEAAAGFSISTNNFATNFTPGSGFVGMSIENLDANNMASSFTASSVTMNVAGGALAAGTHLLSMDFNNLVAMDGSVGGYTAVVGCDTNTHVMIDVASAIPEPSAYAAVAGLLGLLAAAIRRRQRPVT